jgi:hypothetical protein
MGNRAEYDATDYTPRTNTDADTLTRLARDTSRKFHDLMDAAMLVSSFKYGAVAEAYPERVNAIDSLKKRLDAYRKTGNAEYLVDVANFAMIEFMHPAHAKAHYTATDASGSPGRVAANTDVYDRPNQFSNADLEPAG